MLRFFITRRNCCEVMCYDFDLSKSANPGLRRILFETTCLLRAVTISIMASFSSSVKTYLNFGG